MANELITVSDNALASLPAGLAAAILAWADATTDPESARRADLLRDKARILESFFAWANVPPDRVTPQVLKTWQAELEAQGKAAATIYAFTSRVSSFYTWALSSPEMAERIRYNPATLARTKPPKPYQSESTKALDDDQVRDLLRTVKAKAETGKLSALRDYAMLLLYLVTGLRRAEIANLRWGDVKLTPDGLVLAPKMKGGERVNQEVNEPAAKLALLEYLRESGRLATMTPDSPLWTRHDRAGKPGGRLTSHAFAKNLKYNAKQAGIGEIHMHQTRHTYARVVADESGSIRETSDALGHKSEAVTRVYVQRVGVKKDKFSKIVARRFGLGKED